uniref:interleukin-8 n=1 Tax=Jaculus jaculus TaxID=51337 RepID=UPI001E1B2394|nr:interleukin-8 [Jaculus jaculus]
MTCKLAATLCAALLLWAVVCKAVSPTEPSKEFRCQCTMFYAVPINPKIISELRLIERGPQCNSTEMLVKLVDERQFCLNPMKKWVQHLVYSYLKGCTNLGKIRLISVLAVFSGLPLPELATSQAPIKPCEHPYHDLSARS